MRFAGLAFVLLVGTAAASEPYVGIKQGSKVAWSGTVIWKFENRNGIVLTCAHALKKGPVQVLVSRSVFCDGEVRAIDYEQDLATIMVVNLPATMKHVALGTTMPAVGTEVKITGYGKGEFSSRKTDVMGFTRNFRYSDPRQDIDVTLQRALRFRIETRHGDSGAGVIRSGALVGVNVAFTDHNGGAAVPIEEVRAFLADKAGWKFDD